MTSTDVREIQKVETQIKREKKRGEGEGEGERGRRRGRESEAERSFFHSLSLTLPHSLYHDDSINQN